MGFVADEEAPADTPKGRFLPDERRAAPVIKPEPTFKDAVLSLLAPYGLGRNVSSALSAFDKFAYDTGSKTSETATKFGASAPVAAGLGTAANVGIQTLPMLGGGEIGKVATPALDAAGKGMMRWAINPTATDTMRGKVAPAIQTMLEKGYSPTEGGVAAMRSKVGEYMDQVKTLLDPSAARVDILQAMQNLNTLKSKVGAGTLGEEKIAQIDSVMRSLQQHPSVRGGTSMSIQDAQAMKQANTKDLGDAAYGMGLKPAAERDAIKGVNAALKTGIETGEPAVAPLNASASELLNAIKVSERRAMMEGNRSPLSFGASLATATHNPMAALGLWANSSAAVKGALARALYSGQEILPETFGRAVGGGIGAYNGSPPNSALQKILDDIQAQKNKQ